MQEKSEWIHYQDIEWNDPKFNVFSIDTRDFHCGYRFEKDHHKDISTLRKYPDFFHTEQEIKDLIDRYFNESGGKASWRMFSLTTMQNWKMKYIRIWRTELGFIVCNCDNRAMKKEHLAAPVEQKYLHAH